MPQNFIGDRVRYGLLNERLEKTGITDPVALLNRALLRAWGNLVGPTFGCLTPPTLNLTNYLVNGNYVEIGECVFGYVAASADGDQDYEGGPVKYDPSRTIQAQTTVHVPAATYEDTSVWLWFKRNEGQGATDMRRHWPVSAEVAAPTNTRVEEFVTFTATGVSGTAETNNPANGWFRFARIPSTGWSGGAPDTVELIAFSDGWYLQTLDENAMGAYNIWGPWAFRGDEPLTTRWGLVQQMQSLMNQMAVILDTDNIRDPTDAAQGVFVEATPWHTRPEYGIKQILDRMDSFATRDGMFPAAIVLHMVAGLSIITRAIHRQEPGTPGLVTAVLEPEDVVNRYVFTVTVPAGVQIVGTQVSFITDMTTAYTTVPRCHFYWATGGGLTTIGAGTHELWVEAWDVDPDVNVNTPSRVPGLFDIQLTGRRV